MLMAETGTTEVTVYSFQHDSGCRVFLIDTPGFNDTHRSDTDVLKDVALFLSQTYASNVRLSGIVYLHPITDVRMTGSSLRNLNMFQSLCGDNAFEHIVLATTKWDDIMFHHEGVEREKELMENQSWWGFMIERRSRVVRHTPDKASAMGIVDGLIKLRCRVVLDIQRELVDDNMVLEDTAAGQTVERELIELKRKTREDLQGIKESYENALRNRDEKLAEVLKEERERLDKKILAANQAQEALKISFEKLAEEKTAQYEQLFQQMRDREALMAIELEQQQEEYRRNEVQQLKDRQEYEHQQKETIEALNATKQKIVEMEQQHKTADLERTKQQAARLLEQKTAMEVRFKEHEEAAALKARALEAQMEKTKSRKSSMTNTLAVLGVLTGVVTVGFGLATGNPALIAGGLGGMAGGFAN